MGWQDRDYASEEGYHRATGRRAPVIASGWSISTILLIINVGLFMIASPREGLFKWLVMDADLVLHGHIWRLLTPCFLHWDSGHLLFNMIALYCFGTSLEHSLGRSRFLWIYLVGGVLANVIYVLLFLVGWSGAVGLAAGASGCVYAILGACAIVMPHVRVLVFFIIPMKIRTFLAVFVVWGVINVFSEGHNAGGDAVHLAGLAVGLVYAYRIKHSTGGAAKWRKLFSKAEKPAGAWHRKLKKNESLSREVDRILSKINQDGIASLSAEEKRILARASKQQKAEEDSIGRADRL